MQACDGDWGHVCCCCFLDAALPSFTALHQGGGCDNTVLTRTWSFKLNGCDGFHGAHLPYQAASHGQACCVELTPLTATLTRVCVSCAAVVCVCVCVCVQVLDFLYLGALWYVTGDMTAPCVAALLANAVDYHAMWTAVQTTGAGGPGGRGPRGSKQPHNNSSSFRE